MSNIENELRRLGDSLREQGSETGGLPARQRRRIKVRRALFATAGAVTAIALVATASYGLNLVREGSDIAPAEEASSTLISFDRSGGFTGDHHVLTVMRDGSGILEFPGSRGLLDPEEFELHPDAMARLRDAVEQVEWARLEPAYRATIPVGVADGYLFQIEHGDYVVEVESGLEPRSLEHLLNLLNGILDGRLKGPITGEPSLSLSETSVRPGDVVQLGIQARDDYIWGVLTPLEAERGGSWQRAGYWRTWLGRGPRILEAITARQGVVEDIGFSGGAVFELRIPQLEPGIYRITKDFISQGNAPVEERTITVEVRFELVQSLCDQDPAFEPTYLPQGWASDLQPGSGGDEGGDALGHFGNAAEPGTRDKASGGFADLFVGVGHVAQSRISTIEVLGSPADLGDIHDGYSVEFTYEGCRYTLAGYGIERDELRRFATGFRPTVGSAPPDGAEQDFSAIWPEDSYEEAKRACDDDGSGSRKHPQAVAVAFGDEMLGWDEVKVIDRTGEPAFADTRFVYELQRKGSRGTSPREPAVIVDAVEVVEGCWSVGSVSRLPDRRATGLSVVVEGRDVRIGVDPLGATSVRIDVVYGERRVSETGAVGEEGLGEFRLGFDPDTSAYALILFYDEAGEVFSATTAKWPAGDFVAG